MMPTHPVRRRVWRATAALIATAVVAACGATAPSASGTSAGGVSPSGTAQGVTVVMIIRHGEKPGDGQSGVDANGAADGSSLTATGWERAHRLVGLFDPATGSPRAGLARPGLLYAAGRTDDGEGARTRETVAPLADALGIAVDTDFGKGQEKQLARDVLTRQGITLISWQHGGIPDIVDAFPAVTPKPPAKWPSDRFDVVWTLTKTADGWHFAQVPELLLPHDSSAVLPG